MPRTKRVARKSLSTKEEIIDTENAKPTNKVSNTRAKRKAVDSDDTHSAKENPVKRNPKMILNDLTELLEKGRQNLHVSAVPDKLSEREVEFEKIRALVEDALVKKKGSSIYISGVPGTGKTETVRRVLKDLEAVSGLLYFVWLMCFNSRNT
jgi:ATPase subunit of ABC transporter with duplicated ATPase domains